MPDEYGISGFTDSFVNTLLAGQKLKLLDEDLKRSRLERLEFESSQQHRERTRLLREQLDASEVRRSQISEGILGLQQQALVRSAKYERKDRPLERKTKEFNLFAAQEAYLGNKQNREFDKSTEGKRVSLLDEQIKAATASTAASDSQTSYFAQKQSQGEKLFPSELAASEGAATTAKANALKSTVEAVGTLGGASAGSTEVDAGDLASLLMSHGIEGKNLKALLPTFYNAVEAKKQELTEHNDAVAIGKQRTADEDNRNRLAALGDAVQTGLRLAENPAAVEGYAALVKPDDYFGNLALKIAQGGTTKLSPVQIQYSKQITDQIGARLEERSVYESELSSATSGSSKAKKAQKEVDRINASIKALEDKLNELYGGSEKPKKSATSNNSVPVIRDKSEYDKLPAGALYRTPGSDTIFTKR